MKLIKNFSFRKIYQENLIITLLLFCALGLFYLSMYRNLNTGEGNIYLNKKEKPLCENEGRYYELKKALKEPEKVCFLQLTNVSQLPSQISALKNLRELHISATNHVEKLPPEIGKLQNLKVLNLMFNGSLKEIPPEIYRLKNLEELLLTNNRLKNLPNDISALKKLKVLRLDYNQLRCLPSDIVELYNLEELYLGENNLEMLPSGIERLKNLKILSVYHNPLVLDQTPQDFLSERYHSDDAKVWKEEITIFKEMAEKGEGITHLARKVINGYLNKIDFFKTNTLTNKEKICIEDYLQNKKGKEWLLL